MQIMLMCSHADNPDTAGNTLRICAKLWPEPQILQVCRNTEGHVEVLEMAETR